MNVYSRVRYNFKYVFICCVCELNLLKLVLLLDTRISGALNTCPKKKKKPQKKPLPVSLDMGIIFFIEINSRAHLLSCVPHKLIVNGKHECKWCHLIMQISCLATFFPRPRKKISRIYIVSCAYETYGNRSFGIFPHYTISHRFRDTIH